MESAEEVLLFGPATSCNDLKDIIIFLSNIVGEEATKNDCGLRYAVVSKIRKKWNY